MTNTDKKITYKIAKKATQLMAVTESSYPTIYKDDVRIEQLKYYAKECLEVLSKREELIQQMVKLSTDRKEYKVLIICLSDWRKRRYDTL